MFDANALFKQRLSAHMKETNRYLKYIFNGHLAIAMFFLLSAVAVYYQQWLAQLPPDFPTAWIIGVIFGGLVSYNPIKTLLQEPDLVFLLPAEQKMDHYFRNALRYSFVNQLIITFFVIAAVSPLYFHTYAERGGRTFLLILVVLFILKAWNLIVNWWMLKVRDKNSRYLDQVVRLLLNSTIFIFMINGDMLFAGVGTFVFILLLVYDLSISRKQAGIAWDLLVEKDRNRMQLFYRIASMFTDVPHLKSRTKKRRWLVAPVNKMTPFDKQHTYDYLYRITFIRSGDYLGMYIRLILIGGLLIYYVPNEWMKMLFALLFIYLSSFQMITLYQHYRTNIWLDLYPIKIEERRRAVTKWLFQLTFLQTALYAITFLVMQSYVGFLLILVGGTLFNLFFMNGYVKQRLKS